MAVNVKDRMREAGMSQVEMILALKDKGIVVQPPQMSEILRGVSTYPKAQKVLKACEEVLDERAGN